MNVIIQSERDDLSTDDVIMWLYHLKPNLSINYFYDGYFVDSISLQLNNLNGISLKINDKFLINSDYFWYRRGSLKSFNLEKSKISPLYNRTHEETNIPIIEFLNRGFLQKNINRFTDNFTNKLEMLNIAKQLGILIPDVLITGNSVDLINFVNEHGKVITKPINNPYINFKYQDFIIKSLTHSKLLTINDIPNGEFEFMPSFFQKYIEKKFEIRSYYLDGVFKSMAIFSQQNERTKIDFRNYDIEKPNRCVPYKLPNWLEKKLHKLMLKLKLNSGSFDIIYTPECKYVFLEVNSIGQFQWVSLNCNYYIEKLIAEKLIKDGN